MNKLLFILVLLLSVYKINSQTTGEKLKLYCHSLDYQNLILSLDTLVEISNSNIFYSKEVTRNREIIKGFTEQIIEIKSDIQQKNKKFKKSNDFHIINLIQYDNQICYYQIFEIKEIKKNGRWIPTYLEIETNNSTVLGDLEVNYKTKYYKDFQIENLFQIEVYGMACGFVGRTTPRMVELMNALIEKDTTKVLGWIKSENTEKQLYAIRGIYWFVSQGVEFTPSTYNLIEEIGSKKGYAYSCSGCIYGNKSIKSIVEEIKQQHKKAVRKIERNKK